MAHAKARLEAANLLVQAGLPLDAISRAYYAMFSAARALLWVKGSRALTHKGVLAETGRLYVKPGTMTVEEAGMPRRGKDRRQESDYGIDLPPTAADAAAMVATAEAFVAVADRLLAQARK